MVLFEVSTWRETLLILPECVPPFLLLERKQSMRNARDQEGRWTLALHVTMCFYHLFLLLLLLSLFSVQFHHDSMFSILWWPPESAVGQQMTATVERKHSHWGTTATHCQVKCIYTNHKCPSRAPLQFIQHYNTAWPEILIIIINYNYGQSGCTIINCAWTYMNE